MEIKEFVAVLSIMKSAIGASEPYTSLLFSEDTIKAYNGHTGIVMKYHTGMTGAIPVDPLIKTLKSLKGAKIDISPKKKVTVLSSDKGENIRLTLNREVDKFFPFDYLDGEEFDGLPDNFQDALGLCYITTGGQILQEYVQGVYFLDNVAISTNDASVSKVELEEPIEGTMFIHNNSIPTLLKVVPHSILIEEKRIVFDCYDHIQVICPLYKDYDKFPYPYKKLLDSFDREYSLPKDFHYAIKKASSALYGSKSKLSQLLFSKDTLTVKTDNRENGIKLTDALAIKSNLEDNFYLNPEQLSKYDFCKKFSVNDISLKLSNRELGIDIVIAKTLK